MNCSLKDLQFKTLLLLQSLSLYTSPLHYTCISTVTHYNLFPTLHCLEPWQCWCSDQCNCCHSDRPRHGGHRGEDSRLIADWPPLPAGKGSYPGHCGRIKECFKLVYRIYQNVYSMYVLQLHDCEK